METLLYIIYDFCEVLAQTSTCVSDTSELWWGTGELPEYCLVAYEEFNIFLTKGGPKEGLQMKKRRRGERKTHTQAM